MQTSLHTCKTTQLHLLNVLHIRDVLEHCNAGTCLRVNNAKIALKGSATSFYRGNPKACLSWTSRVHNDLVCHVQKQIPADVARTDLHRQNTRWNVLQIHDATLRQHNHSQPSRSNGKPDQINVLYMRTGSL